MTGRTPIGDTQSQAEQAYDLIKRDILTCEIEPSSRVTEAEVAERYGFGRASVRTALSRLSQEAFVEVLPRYGYLISPQTLQDARDLFQLQLILEPAAGRLASGRVDPSYLRELNEACKKATHITDPDSAAQFLNANTDLHAAIGAATGNDLLSRFVRILMERLQRFLYSSGRFEEVVRQVAHHHGEVVELLIADEPDEAEEAIRAQLTRSHRIMLEALGRRVV